MIIIIFSVIMFVVISTAKQLFLRHRKYARAYETKVGIHYRGMQWEGGAVDGGSII